MVLIGDTFARATAANDHNMTSDLDLTEYKAVSFDCYGTLIDWETGIAAVLGPWARGQGLELSDEDLLTRTPTVR